jgi:hypothetical protein
VPEGGWATSSVELTTHFGATGGGVEELPHPEVARRRIDEHIAHAAWVRLLALEAGEFVLEIGGEEKRVTAGLRAGMSFFRGTELDSTKGHKRTVTGVIAGRDRKAIVSRCWK